MQTILKWKNCLLNNLKFNLVFGINYDLLLFKLVAGT